MDMFDLNSHHCVFRGNVLGDHHRARATPSLPTAKLGSHQVHYEKSDKGHLQSALRILITLTKHTTILTLATQVIEQRHFRVRVLFHHLTQTNTQQ